MLEKKYVGELIETLRQKEGNNLLISLWASEVYPILDKLIIEVNKIIDFGMTARKLPYSNKYKDNPEILKSLLRLHRAIENVRFGKKPEDVMVKTKARPKKASRQDLTGIRKALYYVYEKIEMFEGPRRTINDYQRFNKPGKAGKIERTRGSEAKSKRSYTTQLEHLYHIKPLIKNEEGLLMINDDIKDIELYLSKKNNTL